MTFLKRIEGFFFAPVSATGFGVLRAAWGCVQLVTFLALWMDVADFYSNAGYLPTYLEPLMVRGIYRFTLLDWVTDAGSVELVYGLLLVALVFVIFGVLPRLSLLVSLLLVFSFHERMPFNLTGGDTLLRAVGFMLLIAPGIDAFSLSRLRKQYGSWRKTGTLLPPRMMPIWPYRMLLWQFCLLYGTSLWFKMQGDMWRDGTAVESVMHHPVFARWAPGMMNLLTPFTPVLNAFDLIAHLVWLPLLLPRQLRARLAFPHWHGITWKQLTLILGTIFHAGIYFWMLVGNFSLAILSCYTGLLQDEDFMAIRRMFHHRQAGPIAVLYDGHCGLCLRSVFWLRMCDWLGRLDLVDFRDAEKRKLVAPDLLEEDLDRAMHIRFADGRTLKGFDAVRALAAHLPPLWIAWPYLWLPGVAPVGRRIYARIAESRNKCSHEACSL